MMIMFFSDEFNIFMCELTSQWCMKDHKLVNDYDIFII